MSIADCPNYTQCGHSGEAECDADINGIRAISTAAQNREPTAEQEIPEIARRVMRAAGKTLRDVRNPNITARECIELANWIKDYGDRRVAGAVPQWQSASVPPLESDGEVLALMQDGTCEIAWATYWHGSSTGFAQWTFRDPDMQDATPTHWMPLPKHPGKWRVGTPFDATVQSYKAMLAAAPTPPKP